MENKNPMLRLWELGENQHSGLIKAIFLSIVGVIFGMIPYFAASKIIIGLLNSNLTKSEIIFWCTLSIIGYFLKAILYNLSLSFSHKATFTILKNVREKVLFKLPNLPLGTILDTSSGKIKQIIVDQIESMEVPLAHLLPEMTANVFGPLLILIYLFIIDWKMALLSLVSIPLGFSFMSAVMKNYPQKYAEAVETSQYMNNTVVEYFNGIEVIKAFNQGKSSYSKFIDSVKANASFYYNWMKECQLPMSLSKTIVPTTMITILPIGWIMYINGSLSIESFITTIMLSLGITGPLLAAMDFVDSLAKVGTIIDSVDSILLAEEQEHSNVPVKFSSMDIKLDNVSFGYNEDTEILHNISLDIKEGSKNAFVGPSGSGKSTIAKLIAGFWDVSKGNISIGGHDLNNVPLEQIYDQVAFVSQDNYLFDESILENIRMGNLNASDEDVIKVSKLSGCDKFINKLENGYNTIVGNGGTHLSGGERQRISIARAMLKNSPIVILDEATAYIDPENEDIVQKSISNLVKGKTVITIAHRMSTIVDSDKIFVVSDGVIKNSGTHEELLNSDELYKSMWFAHINAKDGEEND